MPLGTGVVGHRSWVANTPTRGHGRTSHTGSDPRARETVTAATRAENAQPWAVGRELHPGAGTPTARGRTDLEEGSIVPRPCLRPCPAPPIRSRADTRLAPPPSLTGRAPPARAGANPARRAGYLLVERDGLILIVSVLAAVGGTRLHHPSGLQSLHFGRSSRQAKLLSMSPRWALTPSLLL